ncbi:hypothetical protein [Enterococcus sp.]|uniref:hypothetical protein n=1 Tax=Enterococcus sp. TaxID=35783 RepID=UPI00290924FC|nr:hypothetical protein [Enterococcus sp.]MDU5335267.1 hypothetical protein [Enterococcus sp.]
MQKLKSDALIILKKLKQPANLFLIILLVGLTVFRLVLSAKAPYFTNLFAGYDDQLFIHYSEEILNGNWLGAYSTKTLSKGISYSLFIVWANKLHLSYGMFLGLFNVLACSVATFALRPLVNNRWITTFIYMFFLYSPVTLTSEYSTRIYRNTLVVPAVVLVIACLVGLYFRRNGKLRSFVFWSLGLSLVFPFYWYIREDSLWLFPLMIVGLLIIAGSVIFENVSDFRIKNLRSALKKFYFTRTQLAKLLLCVLPFVFLYSTTTVLKNINKEHYGIELVNDRTGGAFGDVSKQLIRMDDGTKLNQNNSKVWVSRKALEKAEAASPTLKSIAKNIDWIYQDSPWSGGEDIAGDIIFWALRDAAAQAGYYKDGQKTEQFWQKVDSELSEAYKNGKLKKKKELYLTATGDGKLVKDLPLVADFMKSGFSYNVFYKNYSQGANGTLGPKEEIKKAETLLRHSFSNNWQDVNAPQNRPIKASKISRISDSIIKWYQNLLPLWLLVTVTGILVIIFGSLFSKEQLKIFRGMLLILLGLVLSYLIFLIGVSWFCSWAPERKEMFMMIYTGAGVPVIQWLEVLALVGILQLPIIAKKLNKKNS